MTTIELRHVSFTARDGSVLLDDVNLLIPSGSTVAITGPSGAGKSLLLRILAGLDDPSEGEILFDDVNVTAHSPRQRDTAVVFQDHALHDSRDVYDNLAFASTLRRGYDKLALAARIDEVAGELALGDLLDATPATLDDAQHQRVALGRALVRDARLYLFDEPFAAQPERIRTNVRSVTSQWQKAAARTTIITTSSVTEALTVADTVIVMHQGFVHQVGTARELYDAPRNMFVAAFLGSPPMNLLPAFPSGQQLITPLTTILLDDDVLARIGDRQVVVAGIRPEDCLNSTEPGAGVISDRVEFTTRVDDVEWRGSSQYAYLGFELDPAVTDLLDEVEDLLEFDLFQNFMVAELSATSTLRPGHSVRIVIPRGRVNIFDPETGENLTLNDA